ncbi:hypothetical protein MTP99_004664 [Tenebrio molitor]|nr:hypothetical protein MTP99_004664 [Tenebrio molitor]
MCTETNRQALSKSRKSKIGVTVAKRDQCTRIATAPSDAPLSRKFPEKPSPRPPTSEISSPSSTHRIPGRIAVHAESMILPVDLATPPSRVQRTTKRCTWCTAPVRNEATLVTGRDQFLEALCYF